MKTNPFIILVACTLLGLPCAAALQGETADFLNAPQPQVAETVRRVARKTEGPGCNWDPEQARIWQQSWHEPLLNPIETIRAKEVIKSHLLPRHANPLKMGTRKYLLPGFDSVIFSFSKKGSDSDETEIEWRNAQAAVNWIGEQGLNCLRVPRMQKLLVETEHGHVEVVAIEKVDIETSLLGNEERFEFFYNRFADEPEWKGAFRELFYQLSIFVGQMGLWDLKFNNVPLDASGSTIYLVDLDFEPEGFKIWGRYDSAIKNRPLFHLFWGGGNIFNDKPISILPSELFDDVLAGAADFFMLAPEQIMSQQMFSEQKARKQKLRNHKLFLEWLLMKNLEPNTRFELAKNALVHRLNRELAQREEDRPNENRDLSLVAARTFKVNFSPELVSEPCKVAAIAAQELLDADLIFAYVCDPTTGDVRVQG